MSCGPCSTASELIHMTSQRWPSGSRKLRPYMKPMSIASRAAEPPAPSAVSANSSTPSRLSADRQMIASVVLWASATGVVVKYDRRSAGN